MSPLGSSARLSSFIRVIAGVLLAAGGVYGSIYARAGADARAAFREAERFRRWAENPTARDLDLESDYVKAHRRLSAQGKEGAWSADDLRLEEDILRARYEMRRSESPAKRAYFAYRDVYQRFSPPETSLSRRARLLAPAAKQSWREEVSSRGLPVTDEMFDPEPGETGDRRVVFSTRDGFEAANLGEILRGKGIPCEVVAAGRASAGADRWLAVPSSEFWRAHAELRSLMAPDLPPVFVKS